VQARIQQIPQRIAEDIKAEYRSTEDGPQAR
jgi:hypothetical protein